MWLALVRSWLDAPVATWQALAVRGEAGAERLSARDREIAAALLARANGDMARPAGDGASWPAHTSTISCRSTGWWTAWCTTTPWFGMPSSRSGWRFRANFGEANEAYKRAFALFTPIYRSLEPDAPGSVRSVYQSRYLQPSGGPCGAAGHRLRSWPKRPSKATPSRSCPCRLFAVMAGDASTIPSPGSIEGARRRLQRAAL